MAVKASGSITLAAVTDVSAVTPYYKAQTSTLSPPSKPTSVPPSGWSATQPAVDTSNTCYIVWLMEYSNGTWGYSDVSTFSEYEAAKAAQATASSALATAQATEQHFWFTGTGEDAGAHITKVTKAEFLSNPEAAGGNSLITSNGMQVRRGTTTLARFESSSAQIGKDTGAHLLMTPSQLKFYGVMDDKGNTSAKLSFVNDDGDFPIDTYMVVSENEGFKFRAGKHSLDAITGEIVFLPNQHISAKLDVEYQALKFYTYTMDSAGEDVDELQAFDIDVSGNVSAKGVYNSNVGTAGANAGYKATRTDTSRGVFLCVSTDGQSIGVWDVNKSNWIIRHDGSGALYTNLGAVADQVIQQGTSGIWTYRKWSSGIAECWGSTPSTTFSYSSQWGSAYYTNEKLYSFPNGLFKSATYPEVTCSVWDNGGLGWATVKTLNYAQVGFYLSNPISTTRTTQLYIHANGVWK